MSIKLCKRYKTSDWGVMVKGERVSVTRLSESQLRFELCKALDLIQKLEIHMGGPVQALDDYMTGRK